MGVPIIRTIVFGGLYWGTLVLGNYQMKAVYFCISVRPPKDLLCFVITGLARALFQHLHYGQALAHLGQEGQRKLYKSNMTVL